MAEERQETFFDFFKRPNQQYSTEVYENRLRTEADVSDGIESRKYQTLFAESFGHHIQFNLNVSPEIRVVQNSTRRIVEADGLTSYFLEKLYTPPNLYESDNAPPPDKSERTFHYFFDRVTENPVTKSDGENASEGSNLITFLIGEVGTGKTLLLCKLVRDIVQAQTRRMSSGKEAAESGHHPWIVPIYFDFESQMKNNGKLHDIDESFYRSLFTAITRTLSQTIYVQSLLDGKDIAAIQLYTADQALVHLIQYLHSHAIRLVLVFDNMDGYHYFYSKYAFFHEYYAKQLDSIQRNITRLINTFTQGHFLGMLGLSVVFATRKVVYRDCARFADPEFSNGFSGAVFQVEKTSGNLVARTRLDLFTEAIRKIEQHQSTQRLGKDFRKTLERVGALLGLKAASDQFAAQSPSSEAAVMLSRIGHQGNRSLVQFLSSLQLDHRNEGELFERFFTGKPHTLILLYIAHLHERYTQDEGHFPNLFLVDSMVRHNPSFPLAHGPHVHTYWLKYLILSLVYQSPDRMMNTNILRNLLHDDGQYEEKLVNLTLGSLSMSRDSWCLEPGGGSINSTPSFVKLTDRGRYLMESPQESRAPFCFSFTYLQLIVDDYLMSYPHPLFNEIYVPEVNLRYLCEDRASYSTGLRRYLNRKMRAVLAFILLLRVSWTFEQARRRYLFENLERHYRNVIPDFQLIGTEMMNEFSRILRAFEPTGKELSDLHQYDARLHQEYEPRVRNYLERYYASNSQVEE